MAVNLTCSSCSDENAQRISDIVQQQALTGSQRTLASQYHPPKQPWAYFHGFLLGVPVNTAIMLTMSSPEASESTSAIADIVSSVAFLSVWGGYGVWKNKTYTKKLNEWKNTIASKVLCLRCGHLFSA